VPYDSVLFTSAVVSLVYSETMDRLIWEYYILNRKELAAFHNIAAFAAGFHGDEQLLHHFLNLLDARDRVKANHLLENEKVRRFALQHIRAGLARILFKSNGYYTIQVAGDNCVQAALRMFGNGEYLKLIHR